MVEPTAKEIFWKFSGEAVNCLEITEGRKQEVVWCNADRKYIWGEGEQDNFKCRIKELSMYLDIEADRYALEWAGLSLWMTVGRYLGLRNGVKTNGM